MASSYRITVGASISLASDLQEGSMQGGHLQETFCVLKVIVCRLLFCGFQKSRRDGSTWVRPERRAYKSRLCFSNFGDFTS